MKCNQIKRAAKQEKLVEEDKRSKIREDKAMTPQTKKYLSQQARSLDPNCVSSEQLFQNTSN